MPHPKTPDQSNAASDNFLEQDAEAHGIGADNAPAHKSQSAPGEQPIASDSGNSSVGVDASANQRGEKGLKDATFGEK